MIKENWLNYHRELNGFIYFYKGQPIYRFELYLKGITVASLRMDTAENITKKERPSDRT